MTKHFSFSTNNSPMIEALRLTYQESYGFCEPFKFSFKVNDSDINDQLKIYMKRNGNNELLKTIEKSDGINHEFNLDIENLHNNGKEIISFYVTDKKDVFSTDDFHFSVKRNPNVYITTKYDKKYQPGTKIEVKGFLGDFEPGKYAQAFYTENIYHRSYGAFSFIASPQLIVDRNYRTVEFNFSYTLPEYDCKFFLDVYGNDKLTYYSTILNFIINRPPKIISINSWQEQWRIFESVQIDMNVSESSYAKLKYYYDDEQYSIHELEMKYINHTNLNAKWLINAPPLTKYSSGPHKITLFLEDEFEERSENITKDFTLIESYAPELNQIKTDKNEYIFFENAKIVARFRDFDIGQKLNLFAIIGSGNPQLCGEAFSIGTWQNITVELPVPKVQAEHEIIVFVVDETGGKSNYLTTKIKVIRRKEIFLFNKLKRFYYPGEVVPFSFQFIDFEPGSTVYFNYSFDDNEIQSFGKYKILANSSSNVIHANLVIPNLVSDHYFFYWPASESGEYLMDLKHLTVGISFKPKLKLLSEVKPAYFNPAYVLFNLSVNASTSAHVVYNTSLTPNVYTRATDLEVRSFKKEIPIICQAKINIDEDTEFDISVYVLDRYNDISEVYTRTIRVTTSKPSMKLSLTKEWYTSTYFKFGQDLKMEVKLTQISSTNPITILYTYDSSPWKVYKSINYTASEIKIPIQIQVPPIYGEHVFYIIAVTEEEIQSNFVSGKFASRLFPSLEITQYLPRSAPPNKMITIQGYVSDYPANRPIDVEFKYGNKAFSIQQVSTNENYRSGLFNFTFDSGNELKLVRYSLQIKGQSSSKFEGDLIVNNPPVIENHTVMNPRYWEGDHVNLDYYVQDNTAALVKTQVDEFPIQVVQKQKRYYGEKRFSHSQYLVTETQITTGKHELKYWAEDEFNAVSDVQTFELNFDPSGNKTPELDSCYISLDQHYGFWRPYQMKCTVRDRNENDIIKLRYKIDFEKWKYLEQTWTATGRFENYDIKFDLPNIEGEHYITMQFVDEKGAGTQYVEDYIEIKRKPDIVFIDGNKQGFKPGDSVVIEVYAVDFEPGERIKIYSDTEPASDKRLLFDDDRVEIFLNYSSGPFRIAYDIPIDAKPSKSFLIGVSSTGKTVKKDVFYTINVISEIYVISTFEQQYPTTGGYVDLDVRVKDNGQVRVMYYIDNPPFLPLTEYIDSKMQEIDIYNLQIPIPRGLPEGDHTLFIFAQDDYEVSSNVLQFGIRLTDAHPPVIITSETKEYSNLTYLDTITINGSVYDVIVVTHRIDGNNVVEIFRIESDGNWHNFTYSYTIPKNSQTVTSAFQAVRNNFKSQLNIYRYSVYEPEPTVYSPPAFPNMNYEECTPGLSCIAEPQIFEHATVAEILNIKPSVPRIKFNFEGSTNDIVLDTRVLSSMTLDDLFKYANATVKTNNITVTLTNDNNETVQTLIQPIIINEQPILKVNNKLQDKVYGSNFIDLDFTINDDTSATVGVIIDDNNEINITDLIQCMKQEKSGKTQIPIPNDTTFRSHDMTIFAVDEFGAYSNVTKHTFFFYDFYHPPTIEVDDIEDKMYSEKDIIRFQGRVDDLDLDDTIFVKVRIDNEEFETKHTCLPENRPNCLIWGFNYQVPIHNGNISMKIRAEDSRNSQSKDVEKIIRLPEREEKEPVPLRTPDPIPYPSRLPIDFTGKRTTILVPTYTLVSKNGADGPTLTYDTIMSEYEVAVFETNDTDVNIPFLETVFGKYVLWPLLVFFILIIVGIIILIILLKKKKEKEEEKSEEPVEMDNETVQALPENGPVLTNDNPLWTTKNGEDDPFKNDFEEENPIPQDDQVDNEEIEDFEDTP